MTNLQEKRERPPVVVVMGHVDHGKSALLDYIRKSNVVESEAGGITQHINAYEVKHSDKKITFIDTPGHEAFGKMRARGAKVADIAILVVSAEDGVKKQTIEALEAIKTADIPYIIAINKIDKPGANIVQTQSSLVENEIYIEGMGGDVPWNAISAKTGEGVNDLLDTILLVAEMQELKGNPNIQATGVVIEAHRDARSGITATLLIKDGTVKIGDFIVAGTAITPIRTIKNYSGDKIKIATFSSPIEITGFNELPKTGIHFQSFKNKKDATNLITENISNNKNNREIYENIEGITYIALIIKTDVHGTLDAIMHEIQKLNTERTSFRVVLSGVGSISESDIQTAIGSGALVIGFNVKTDSTARDVARQHNINVQIFNIIYKLSEWLEEMAKQHTPKRKIEKIIGEAKVIKIFSETKKSYVFGGKVKDGEIKKGVYIHIERRGEHIANGKITNLQSGKQAVEKIEKDTEFGAQIEVNGLLAEGDRLKAYEIIEE